jgi:hypothetical protein
MLCIIPVGELLATAQVRARPQNDSGGINPPERYHLTAMSYFAALVFALVFALASASHFFRKLFLATPANFMSPACLPQEIVPGVAESLSHFLMKLFLAAPASFFSVALASQTVGTWATAASFSHLVMKLFLAAPANFLSVA